jgi:predicted enzyme related to lactoylglutathione lyase
MSDLNSQHNRVVWVDIPVKNLDRAMKFYAALLGKPVSKVEMPGMSFAVLDHEHGNGGCLVENAAEVSATAGILVYFNADGRIRAAVAEVEKNGGQVVQPIHSIGPHGFRAIIIDCEGNRLAVHSQTDQ